MYRPPTPRAVPEGGIIFQSIRRALLAPIRLIQWGRIGYGGYLTVGGATLGVVCVTVHRLFLEELSRLLSTGAIHVQDLERMRVLLPAFVGILALPVACAVIALPIRNYRGGEGVRFGALIRATPRASVRAGATMIALAFHSFRLLIPFFLLGCGYIFVLETFGSRAALIGGGIIALGFIPAIVRFVAPLVAPLVAVLTETSGRAAITESKRRGSSKLAHLWFVLTVATLLMVLTMNGGQLSQFTPNTRIGIVIFLAWYSITILAHLMSDHEPPSTSRNSSNISAP